MKRLAAVCLALLCACAYADIRPDSGPFSTVKIQTKRKIQTLDCPTGKLYRLNISGPAIERSLEAYAAVCRSETPSGRVNPAKADWIVFHKSCSDEKDTNVIGTDCQYKDEGWACRQWQDIRKSIVDYHFDNMKPDEDADGMVEFLRN